MDDYIPLPPRDLEKTFLMPVEDVFSIAGRGTVVTGRIEQGKIKVGEEIEIVGLKETVKSTCTGVEMFKKNLNQGEAGDNVGILLRGLKREDVQRGQVCAWELSCVSISVGWRRVVGVAQAYGVMCVVIFGYMCSDV